ncbi:MAG: ParB N-terminal domain-containing protein [Desulfamplus sp.]|nr:ParB N-terminal domain-containing protein [Desulfamplus sp.]
MAKRINLLVNSGAAEVGRAQSKLSENLPPANALKSDIHISKIKPRPKGNTRELNPLHVLDLAESISALGLLQPIAIDESNQLVAGEHRIEACRLLCVEDAEVRVSHWRLILSQTGKTLSEKADREAQKRVFGLDSDTFCNQYQGQKIPVLVLPFKADEDPTAALAAETAENEKRQNYTKAEILNLANRLRSAGYIEKPGRPKKTEKSLKNALVVISGKSLVQIHRDLNSEKTLSHDRVFSEAKAIDKICRCAQSFLDLAPKNNEFKKDVSDFLMIASKRLSLLNKKPSTHDEVGEYLKTSK